MASSGVQFVSLQSWARCQPTDVRRIEQHGGGSRIRLIRRVSGCCRSTQARCFLTLSYLAGPARPGEPLEQVRHEMEAQHVPNQLVHALEKHRSKTALASSILAALAGCGRHFAQLECQTLLLAASSLMLAGVDKNARCP